MHARTHVRTHERTHVRTHVRTHTRTQEKVTNTVFRPFTCRSVDNETGCAITVTESSNSSAPAQFHQSPFHQMSYSYTIGRQLTVTPLELRVSMDGTGHLLSGVVRRGARLHTTGLRPVP
ncbi:hypothetical protein EVAR_83569_1 [Eumeta japonica]|uniref:Uncharacterized protein n=1 Tax=Eumeta variegata TaxID=151549 RepID=A0A4C1UP00_EUMVA|nr:hypothetical protein EVAR_83569_1 [Eumeta japonica]